MQFSHSTVLPPPHTAAPNAPLRMTRHAVSRGDVELGVLCRELDYEGGVERAARHALLRRAADLSAEIASLVVHDLQSISTAPDFFSEPVKRRLSDASDCTSSTSSSTCSSRSTAPTSGHEIGPRGGPCYDVTGVDDAGRLVCAPSPS